MICPYCNKDAKFVSNENVYGQRYGRSYMIWRCENCDAHVGVHHNDPNKPLGTMANNKLRSMRINAHAVFDKIWKDGHKTRTEAYDWLNKSFPNMETIHIGQADEKLCSEIIELSIKFLMTLEK